MNNIPVSSITVSNLGATCLSHETLMVLTRETIGFVDLGTQLVDKLTIAVS